MNFQYTESKIDRMDIRAQYHENVTTILSGGYVEIIPFEELSLGTGTSRCHVAFSAVSLYCHKCYRGDVLPGANDIPIYARVGEVTEISLDVVI